MKVTWEIDIEKASGARTAALRAFMIMQRRDTSAAVFKVRENDGSEAVADLVEIALRAVTL